MQCPRSACGNDLTYGKFLPDRYVFCPDGISVHCTVRKGRHINARGDVSAQYKTIGLFDEPFFGVLAAISGLEQLR